MIKALRVLLVLGCFLFCQIRAKAGSELILKVKVLDEKAVNSIRHHLQQLEGVRFWGYHVNSSCLLLTFESGLIQEKELVFNISALLDHTTTVQQLSGYKIFDILDGKYLAQEETD